jgi:two-component system response regulator
MSPILSNVLVAEDNSDDLELLTMAFSHHLPKEHLFSVRDGQEAIDFFFSKENGSPLASTIKLILLDLKLPKLGGNEVLARLKGDNKTRNIPVIICTSSSRQTDAEECYRLGANSYLIKPLDFSEFEVVVKRLLDYWLKINFAP